jgi:hypothetical protein
VERLGTLPAVFGPSISCVSTSLCVVVNSNGDAAVGRR